MIKWGEKTYGIGALIALGVLIVVIVRAAMGQHSPELYMIGALAVAYLLP